MDQDFLSANDFEGECFISIKDLPVISKSGENDDDLKIIDIQDLPLSQPSRDGQYHSFGKITFY